MIKLILKWLLTQQQLHVLSLSQNSGLIKGNNIILLFLLFKKLNIDNFICGRLTENMLTANASFSVISYAGCSIVYSFYKILREKQSVSQMSILGKVS